MTPHGSYSTYVNHKCRCGECRAANAAYNRARRRDRAAYPITADRAGHGRNSTYTNYGCRCLPCREAHRLTTP